MLIHHHSAVYFLNFIGKFSLPLGPWRKLVSILSLLVTILLISRVELKPSTMHTTPHYDSGLASSFIQQSRLGRLIWMVGIFHFFFKQRKILKSSESKLTAANLFYDNRRPSCYIIFHMIGTRHFESLVGNLSPRLTCSRISGRIGF